MGRSWTKRYSCADPCPSMSPNAKEHLQRSIKAAMEGVKALSELGVDKRSQESTTAAHRAVHKVLKPTLTHNAEGITPLLPIFNGKDRQSFVCWLSQVGNYFRGKYLSELEKYNLVVSCLKEFALLWFTSLEFSRTMKGKSLIRSWSKLEYHMRKKYMPSYDLTELEEKLRKAEKKHLDHFGSVKPCEIPQSDQESKPENTDSCPKPKSELCEQTRLCFPSSPVEIDDEKGTCIVVPLEPLGCESLTVSNPELEHEGANACHEPHSEHDEPYPIETNPSQLSLENHTHKTDLHEPSFITQKPGSLTKLESRKESYFLPHSSMPKLRPNTTPNSRPVIGEQARLMLPCSFIEMEFKGNVCSEVSLSLIETKFMNDQDLGKFIEGPSPKPEPPPIHTPLSYEIHLTTKHQPSYPHKNQPKTSYNSQNSHFLKPACQFYETCIKRDVNPSLPTQHFHCYMLLWLKKSLKKVNSCELSIALRGSVLNLRSLGLVWSAMVLPDECLEFLRNALPIMVLQTSSRRMFSLIDGLNVVKREYLTELGLVLWPHHLNLVTFTNGEVTVKGKAHYQPEIFRPGIVMMVRRMAMLAAKFMSPISIEAKYIIQREDMGGFDKRKSKFLTLVFDPGGRERMTMVKLKTVH